jgi:hypothetical protein
VGALTQRNPLDEAHSRRAILVLFHRFRQGSIRHKGVLFGHTKYQSHGKKERIGRQQTYRGKPGG